jgi:hypothetical protein
VLHNFHSLGRYQETCHLATVAENVASAARFSLPRPASLLLNSK